MSFRTKLNSHLLTIVILSAGLGGCLHQQARVDGQADPAEGESQVVAAEELKDDSSLTAESTQTPEHVIPDDIWERIRLGMQLEGKDHPGVKNDLEWFARHQSYLDRVAERATPYMHLIMEEVEARGMPAEIALLPVVESAFQPFAYSHGRAAGIWQFIPGTGRRFGLKQSWWYDGRRNIAESTHAALQYLQFLHRTFDGDWLLALAAYNSGEGTVLRAIRKNRKKNKPTDFWHLDLPRETRGYVPKLLAISSLVADPAKHEVSLPPIPNVPFLTPVDVGSQIDLDLAAELAGITLEEMYRYNPGFNRWATDPDGPHQLLVPVDNAEQLEEQLASLSDDRRVHWTRHKIKSGESLGVIADRHRTTVSVLKRVNGLKGTTIRAGQMLVIPVARQKLNSYSLSSEQRRLQIQNRPRNGSKMEYLVQQGDSLWSISRKFGVGTEQLAKWNAMAPRDVLQPGRRLVIWGKAQKENEKTATIHTSLAPSNFTHPHSEDLRRRVGYVVRSGDSLARISQRFKVTVSDLMRWNNLNAGQYLQPGQRLTIFVDVTQQAGNT